MQGKISSTQFKYTNFDQKIEIARNNSLGVRITDIDVLPCTKVKKKNHCIKGGKINILSQKIRGALRGHNSSRITTPYLLALDTDFPFFIAGQVLPS